jgi:hypothetical protein
VAGWDGVTQTATFAAAEFDVGTGAQADLLSAVRASIGITLALMVLADRIGRRRILTFAAVAGVAATAAGAFAPSMLGLGVTQVVARGFAGTLLLLIGIVAAEEMPAGSRAWAVSVLAMCQAWGRHLPWALPSPTSAATVVVAGPVRRAAASALVLLVHRHLPESRRFQRSPVRGTFKARGPRPALLAAGGHVVPARPVRHPGEPARQRLPEGGPGFSGAQIAAFTLITAAPPASARRGAARRRAGRRPSPPSAWQPAPSSA